MTFGGTPKPPAVSMPPPMEAGPDIHKAQADLRERLRRARSRAMSQVIEPGLMDIMPPVTKPALSDILG